MQIRNLKFTRLAAAAILIAGFGANASASCGDSLSAMAAQVPVVQAQSRPLDMGARSKADQVAYSSIVGLWHMRFMIGDQTIQEAFQLWNSGGTEAHNPNVDPRSGNICFGVWKRMPDRVTYKLTHRVWHYDSNGNFLGTIHLAEKVTLGDHGTSHGGSFSLDFFDPAGNFQFEVAGDVVAERIGVE